MMWSTSRSEIVINDCIANFKFNKDNHVDGK